MAIHTPHPVRPDLHGFIHSVWSLRRSGPSPCPVLPDASAGLVVGEVTSWRRGVAEPLHGAHVLGVVRRSWPLHLPERGFVLAVGFRPGCTGAFFDVPAWELTDEVRRLSDLWGPAASAIAEDVASAVDAEDAAERLQRHLAARCKGLRRERWLHHVEASRGRVTVDELARLAGVTRQHLARRARETVGVSPKLLCRLTRFQHALEMASGGVDDWSAAAHALGYVDQSHLSADFREFTGAPPARFAASFVA